MDNPNMVNIGTAERPIIVPEKALYPDSDCGRDWWGKVAEGSVVLEVEVLDQLLGSTKK